MSFGHSHLTPTSKRSTSCSYNPSKLTASTTNNNNHFCSSRSPGMSTVLQQVQGTYSPSTYRQYKGPSYLHNSLGPSRYGTRDPTVRRDHPVKSTYRPGNIDEMNYISTSCKDSRHEGLLRSGRDISDLSLSGLSLSGLKKSTSNQDMSHVLASNQPRYRYRHFPSRVEQSRPLPDLERIPQSDLHSSRRSSFARGRLYEDSVVRSSVADTVARLNRRNEAEKGRTITIGRSKVEELVANDRSTREDKSIETTKEVVVDDDRVETSSSSSTTNSPNNNTNNFSKKYIHRGCTGLQNIGNTCFMNCVLQCLSNTRPLLELCLNSDLLREINTETSRLKGSLATAYVDLMQTMWKGLDSVSPSHFKYEVSRIARLFAGFNQQDAQEFLMYLLQGLHEDLNRVRDKKKRLRRGLNSQADDDRMSATEKAIVSWKRHLELENSYIVDLFEGLLKSALKCRLCGYVSNTFDPFLGLSLPIKKVPGYGETTLMDCFELFTHEELLDENEKSTCDKCKKKQNSTKRLSIQKFPQILIINLKRFSEESLFRSKLSTLVRSPVKNLDLRRFSDENVGDRAIYNLYGVCNHSGTTFGGHYTALARNPYSNDWHHFNDQRVTNTSENFDLVTSEAYILFYELNSK